MPSKHSALSHDLAALARARALYEADDTAGALVILNELLETREPPRGTQYLRSLCFFKTNHVVDSLHSVEAELAQYPDDKLAREQFEKVDALGSVPGSNLPARRPWWTKLDPGSVPMWEHHSHRYSYKAVPMVKNVFDLAIYPMLMWEVKPATIIEVGSYYGGSAIWLADMLGGFGLDTHIYSIDIARVSTVSHPRVTFLRGSGQNLGALLSDEFLATIPRPLLVIEDADHSNETTTAVLNFFHNRLHDGERIIVEDVMTATGAALGLKSFLEAHPDEYLIDQRYCDFYGTNVTWCVNGFLKRVRPSRRDEELLANALAQS